MRDDREKLRDILEAIERIERYAVQGQQSFEEVHQPRPKRDED